MKQLTIRNKSEDVAEVLLYDQIGEDPFFGDGVSAKTFREQIKSVKAKTINLRINSPGGMVTEAAAMMAALDAFKGRVEVDIDGLAASAASVVAMAGDEIRMASNALMMIHDPIWAVFGNAEAMRSAAETLDKVKSTILDSYARHAKVSRDKLAEMMAAETWLTGAEAIDAGLVHSLTDAMSIAAHVDLSKFRYRNAPKMADVAPVGDPETEKRRQRLAAMVR